MEKTSSGFRFLPIRGASRQRKTVDGRGLGLSCRERPPARYTASGKEGGKWGRDQVYTFAGHSREEECVCVCVQDVTDGEEEGRGRGRERKQQERRLCWWGPLHVFPFLCSAKPGPGPCTSVPVPVPLALAIPIPEGSARWRPWACSENLH